MASPSDEERRAEIRCRVQKARTALVLDEPFFGVLAMRLQLQEDPGAPTFWVDGVSLGYNPEFAYPLSDHQLKAVLCHEVLHVAAGHPWRREGRDPTRWNDACDYAINPLVQEAGYILPPGGLMDPRFAGKSAEQIYRMLVEQQGPPSGNQGGARHSTGPQASGAPEGDEGTSDSGGSPGGQPPCPTGEVRDCPVTGEEGKQLAQDWAQATAQAAAAARGQGKLPGGLKAFVKDSLAPKLDWKELLRRFVQQAWQAVDYTWKMPNQRYLAHGLYLPRLHSETLPCIVVGIDTSGSCLADQAKFKAEIEEIISEVGPEQAYLVYCDAQVQRVESLTRGDEFEYRVVGGGGTSFVPVFDWVEKEGLAPGCLIYLTDLMGTFPPKEPEYPVLWVNSFDASQAPWGETIRLTT